MCYESKTRQKSRCAETVFRAKSVTYHHMYFVAEISRIIRLISPGSKQRKFAENFGEFLKHLLFGVTRGDEGCSDFPLCFPLRRYYDMNFMVLDEQFQKN